VFLFGTLEKDVRDFVYFGHGAGEDASEKEEIFPAQGNLGDVVDGIPMIGVRQEMFADIMKSYLGGTLKKITLVGCGTSDFASYVQSSTGIATSGLPTNKKYRIHFSNVDAQIVDKITW